MNDNYKRLSDTGVADNLRDTVTKLAELLAEARDRGMQLTIVARELTQQYGMQSIPSFTQNDSPKVSCVTRTKTERF